MRVMVVGASSGIGRATAARLAEAGDDVAAVARSGDALDELAAAHPTVHAVVADVADDAAATTAVGRSVEVLDGLDAVVYAAGVSRIGLVAESPRAFWDDVFDVNLHGAVAVTRAAVPHLEPDRGRLVYCSSNGTERPWPGMSAYAASKTALDAFIVALRAEHPELGATRVVVGPTATTMAMGWDPELGARLRERWADGGYLPEAPQVQQPDDVAVAIESVLRAPTRITDIRVVPPGV